MAAVWTTFMASLRAGDHVVAGRALFGSNTFILNNFLPRYGIETSLVDGADLAVWEAAIRPNTKLLFIETPSNPTLSLLDIPALAELAHSHGAKLIVDNALASPVIQSPWKMGADIVIYSATKHIDGQGRSLGGAVLSTRAFLETEFQPYLRHTGPALSPFNAWLLSKGLETMPLRVERASATALALARRIEAHPAARRTIYPWLESHPQYALARRQMKAGGTLLSFDLGDKAAAFAFMNALKVVVISNNLGDTKSIITHPMTTTHRAITQEERLLAGITDGLVRLSVGLESEHRAPDAKLGGRDERRICRRCDAGGGMANARREPARGPDRCAHSAGMVLCRAAVARRGRQDAGQNLVADLPRNGDQPEFHGRGRGGRDRARPAGAPALPLRCAQRRGGEALDRGRL
jgi:O-succinylhomoserine sulfhydrylase